PTHALLLEGAQLAAGLVAHAVLVGPEVPVERGRLVRTDGPRSRHAQLGPRAGQEAIAGVAGDHAGGEHGDANRCPVSGAHAFSEAHAAFKCLSITPDFRRARTRARTAQLGAGPRPSP